MKIQHCLKAVFFIITTFITLVPTLMAFSKFACCFYNIFTIFIYTFLSYSKQVLFHFISSFLLHYSSIQWFFQETCPAKMHWPYIILYAVWKRGMWVLSGMMGRQLLVEIEGGKKLFLLLEVLQCSPLFSRTDTICILIKNLIESLVSHSSVAKMSYLSDISYSLKTAVTSVHLCRTGFR